MFHRNIVLIKTFSRTVLFPRKVTQTYKHKKKPIRAKYYEHKINNQIITVYFELTGTLKIISQIALLHSLESGIITLFKSEEQYIFMFT